jgi:hypothetical protein
VEVPNKTTLSPSTKKRGGQEQLEGIMLPGSDQERRRLKLLEKLRK